MPSIARSGSPVRRLRTLRLAVTPQYRRCTGPAPRAAGVDDCCYCDCGHWRARRPGNPGPSHSANRSTSSKRHGRSSLHQRTVRVRSRWLRTVSDWCFPPPSPGRSQSAHPAGLSALTAQPLSGTEGATFPFWRPDSQGNPGVLCGQQVEVDPHAAGASQTTKALAPVDHAWGGCGTSTVTSCFCLDP